MMSDAARRQCVLRFVLLFAGVGWGLSFLFLFWKWESATTALKMMGGRGLEYAPFLLYWMRVIGAIFGCFGVFCFADCHLAPTICRDGFLGGVGALDRGGLFPEAPPGLLR